MMFTAVCLAFLGVGAQAYSLDLDSEVAEAADPRLFFVNFTSSLVQVNSTILTYGLLALAIAGAAGLALYYLYIESANSSSYGYGQSYGSNYGYQQYARSAADGWNFDGLNVIRWISMLKEVYEEFDYNDIECQKRLICEVMQDSETFGNVSKRMSTGFEFAKYLEVMNMPDDFREILDEYIDASDRSHGQKACSEVFQCPYSLRDSVKRNFSGNSL
jgi:hypothetical protein